MIEAVFRPQKVGNTFIFGGNVVSSGGGGGGPVVDIDTEPPVMVGGLVIQSVTATSFMLAWSQATDNMEVTGYEVSVDVGTASYVPVGNVLERSIQGLAPQTAYTVRVRATDGTNVSPALTTTMTTLVQVVASAIPIINRNGEGVNIQALAALVTTGTVLEYFKGLGQELILFNKGASSVVVTAKGDAATGTSVKGTAGAVLDLTQGLRISVPSKQFVTLKLDAASAYLKGVVTVSASVDGAVFAGVLQ